MKTCLKCNDQFPIWVIVDGKKRNLKNRKFCLTCSPFQAHNTSDLTNFTKPQTAYESLKKFRQSKKQKAIIYKGGKCVICGYHKCVRNLSFHHLDPKEKEFNISQKSSWGFEKLKTELDKCILVCANCHGEIHDGLVGVEGFEPTT